MHRRIRSKTFASLIPLGSAARTWVVRAVPFNESDKGDRHFCQVTVTSLIGRKRVVMNLQAKHMVTNATLWGHVCKGSRLVMEDSFFQKILPNYRFFE